MLYADTHLCVWILFNFYWQLVIHVTISFSLHNLDISHCWAYIYVKGFSTGSASLFQATLLVYGKTWLLIFFPGRRQYRPSRFFQASFFFFSSFFCLQNPLRPPHIIFPLEIGRFIWVSSTLIVFLFPLVISFLTLSSLSSL